MNDHIVKSYDNEFAELDRLTAHMGGLTEKLLADAFASLERRDPNLAAMVISSDKAIDALEQQVQDRAIVMIAKRQPLAHDLRHIMTVLKIASDLERIGDLAKNIAKRALAVAGESHPKPLMNGLRHMNELAMRQLKDVLDALSTRDAVKAREVWNSDAGLDALYNSVFRELLTYMMEDPRNIGLCTHLLFGAKNIERIGDHSTNIAENILYLVEGVTMTAERPKGDETSSMILPKPPL
jgi:phosphate transport system protein